MVDESAFETAVVEAHTIQDQTGFLPALDDPRLDVRKILPWLFLDGDDPLDRLIGKQRANDPVTRAVVGATLHVLTADNPTGEGSDTLSGAFHRFVMSVPVAHLTDPALLRWEIHVAATARALERLLEINRQFEVIGPTTEIRGLLATTAFVLVHPNTAEMTLFEAPSAFDSLIHAPNWLIHNVCDLLIYLMATNLETPTELQARRSPLLLDALIEIDTLLRRIQNTAKSLTATQCAIQAWCWFAEGALENDAAKLNRAGNGYETLPAHPLDTRHLSFGVPSAAKCFAMAGNWLEATQAAKKWVAEAPGEPRAYRQLAEAHYQVREITEAVEAYDRYVDLRTKTGDDWEPDMLLQLGLEVYHHRSVAVALETAAFSASIRPQAEKVIAWTYPWFDKLSRDAREQWWVGMFVLTSPHVGAEIGDKRFDAAADAFGEAVARELKASVFLPFAEAEHGPPPDEYWGRVLGGRGMLGDMINCLLQTRIPNHPLATQLSKWLASNRPGVSKHVEAQRQRLLRLAKLRGNAQHGSVTEAETREVFLGAVSFLDAMVGSPADVKGPS